MKTTELFLIILAVMAVAFADVFLKRASTLGSFAKAIQSPWMIAALLMYIFQVFIFTYVFVSGAKLGYVGIVQTVLYALIVLASGYLFFAEKLSPLKLLGAIIAVAGVVMMNF